MLREDRSRQGEKNPLNRSKNVHRLKKEKKRSKDSHRKCKSFINNKKVT